MAGIKPTYDQNLNTVKIQTIRLICFIFGIQFTHSCPLIWKNLKEIVCLKHSSSTLLNMKEADVLYCELHRVYVNMFIDAYILK